MLPTLTGTGNAAKELETRVRTLPEFQSDCAIALLNFSTLDIGFLCSYSVVSIHKGWIVDRAFAMGSCVQT